MAPPQTLGRLLLDGNLVAYRLNDQVRVLDIATGKRWVVANTKYVTIGLSIRNGWVVWGRTGTSTPVSGSPAPCKPPRGSVPTRTTPTGAVYRPHVVGRPLDDRELVARAKRGDADAYEELVHAYQGIALRTAYLIAGNAADAEEAAQDGFVKAHRRSGAFAPRRRSSRGCCRSSRTKLATAAAPRAGGRSSRCGRPGSGLGGRGPVPEAALLGSERRRSCSPRSTA